MTQWIFSANDCLCKMPFTANSGEEKSSERTNQIAAFNFDDPFEGEEIFVESDSFPLDRYRAVRLLGKGTLGEVFLGIDRTLRKPVAIKCLLNVTNQRAISFQNEAKIANKLHHPCLIDVLDFGITSGGRPFMVMEYFDGISLEQLFLEARAISEEVVLCLFTNICDGLGYMHDHGVFHRDLKPSNVLVSISDTMSIAVKIIDFGLAKTTQDLQWKTTVQGKTIVGTPAYMSPDQALGQAFSAASEVYSLGCMLFESLCGRPPFEGETALETINQHVSREIPKVSDIVPNVSADLCLIIDKCLQKSNAQRYQSVAELRESLQSCQNRDKVQALAVGPGTEASRRGKTAALVVALGIIFAAGILSASVFTHSQPPTKAVHHRNPESKSNIPVVSPLLDETMAERPLFAWREDEFDGDLWYTSQTCSDDDLMSIPPDVKALKLDNNSGITDRGIRFLCRLPLQKISLQATSITDRSLGYLAEIQSLQYIRIAQTEITDRGPAILLPLKHSLKTLCIGGKNRRLTKKGLDFIATNFSDLSSLDIADSTLNPPDLACLRKLPHLEHLDLGSMGIKDADLNFISPLHLDSLNLSYNPLTERAIPTIAAMKKLRYVNLTACFGLQESAVLKLTAARPDLNIRHVGMRVDDELSRMVTGP